jgi:hypothetical protein
VLPLADDLDYLDGNHCVFGEVVEGWDTLDLLNQTISDNSNRPYQVETLNLKEIQLLMHKKPTKFFNFNFNDLDTSFFRREMSDYGSSLGSNPDISQKYKMGDISKEKFFFRIRFTIRSRKAKVVLEASFGLESPSWRPILHF